MTATCIVLNGTSCPGTSTIAAALQQLWPRPLQVTGTDTFLAAQSKQSKRFFAVGGRGAAGFSWVPATVAGQPAFDVVPGPLGPAMIKASHAYWAACAGAGLDQVIDHVWLVPGQPAGLQHALLAANTLWVGCTGRWPSPSGGNESAATASSARRAASTPRCTRSGPTTSMPAPRSPRPCSARTRSLPRRMPGQVSGDTRGPIDAHLRQRQPGLLVIGT